MKSPPAKGRNEAIVKKKFFIIMTGILLSTILLFGACSGRSSSDQEQLPEHLDEGGTTADDTYRVIMLTDGRVSPIIACSYDLLHTVVTIQIFDSYDYELLNGCFALIDRYEKLLSRTLFGSEVYGINHSEETSFTVSEELREVLELSLYYAKLSEGALDISIAPVSELWDFTSVSHAGTAPAEEIIKERLPLVNYSHLHLNEATLTFDMPDMQLELGAVAKGYIADKVKEYLIEQGVTSAIINLGGNVLLVGNKPDGSAFKVGIQKPFENRDSVLVAISELSDCSMVSSGIYERYFYDENNRFYHHILNADTGYPCENNLLQVTIISRESGVGDALSTACFALGLEQGLALIDSLENVYAVFMTTDEQLHFSEGYLENILTTIE